MVQNKGLNLQEGSHRPTQTQQALNHRRPSNWPGASTGWTAHAELLL